MCVLVADHIRVIYVPVSLVVCYRLSRQSQPSSSWHLLVVSVGYFLVKLVHNALDGWRSTARLALSSHYFTARCMDATIRYWSPCKSSMIFDLYNWQSNWFVVNVYPIVERHFLGHIPWIGRWQWQKNESASDDVWLNHSPNMRYVSSDS